MAQQVAKDETAPGMRLLLLISLMVPLVLLPIGLRLPHNLTQTLLVTQDRWLLLAGLLCAAAIALPLNVGPASLALSRRQVVGIALVLLLAAWAGHALVLQNYDLSRDEQMADFDTMIYARGHLVWPIPAAWQVHSSQLNLLFMLPLARPAAWISGYLPGNSLMRAALSEVGLEALTGPLLTALSVLLVWLCARRIWPRDALADREAGGVAVILLALSGQAVMAGMSAYSMPAHLFCNMLWLWLFLRDRRGSDLAGLAVGFVGTGLHQPLFHPLFVAPFLFLLLLDRRWGRLALFAGWYAVVVAFWFAWPWVTHAMVTGPLTSADSNGTSYYSRLIFILSINRDHVPMMAANLLRFFTWQHLLLLPLLIAGFGAVRHDRMAAALAAGLVLPVLIMAVIMPFQGHGFGYRYVHGLLGNAALLGGYGWLRLAPFVARLRPLFVRASLATLLVMLPMQAWLTHGLYGIFARSSARISASGADYAVIGADDAPLALDLVLNQPDLSNRPIRLVAGEIDDFDELAKRICHPGVSVALPNDQFFAPIAEFFRTTEAHEASGRLGEETTAFTGAGCRVFELK